MTNPFINAVRNKYQDPDEMKAAAAKVRQTMMSPGWEVLWQFIEESRELALTRLFQGHGGGSGKVMEQAEYARLCAYLAGIREPQTVADAFEQHLAALEDN